MGKPINMFLRKLFLLAYLTFWNVAIAQEITPVASIPQNLRENANAVIRYSQTAINISGRKSMTITRNRIVTVFNEKGLGYIDASEGFDPTTSVKNIQLVIYNKEGQEVKKIKRKDFKEQSVSEGSIITDNKLISYDYVPVQYPFTAQYTSEITTSNTAFLPRWTPIEGYYASVEKSGITVTAAPELGLRYKTYNQGSAITIQETNGGINAFSENIPAMVAEDYSPSFHKMVPHVLFGLKIFHLEGVDGEAKDWESFGAWMYKNLLEGRDELPGTTIDAIRQKTGNETDPLKKAKIVYEYVQSKTRYISIQLGIGGWKPMKAKDVDRLGYGDCKALTNYTRALLRAVGVDAAYTVIYAGTGKRDITPDFVSMQGNHVILAIPHNNTITWLECTSQTAPFGFQGDFTDDRMALMITPEKGVLVRTFVYQPKTNTQALKGQYKLSESGGISGSLQIISKGIQYDNKCHLGLSSQDNLVKHYKEDYSHIHNLKLKKAQIQDSKDTQELIENLAIEGENYWNGNSKTYMFAVNAFNKYEHVPQRYRNRKAPFVIERGFYDVDEVTIDLPEGYSIDAKPENFTITNKFGEYKTEYGFDQPGKITYKRILLVNDGSYPGEEYENYRLFREKISRNDNAKVVLVKK